jgi:hypothetical protein
VRLRAFAHGDEPIACDQGGCCLWMARTSVVAARRRLYEAARGSLPRSARLVSTCGTARCVNLDHLRMVPAGHGTSVLCRRGHELTRDNVVRHRDGRIAYCKACRNERRREHYRNDAKFAAREIERQRVLRARSSSSQA